MGGTSCPKPTYKKPKPEKVQQIIMQSGKFCWVCGGAPEYGLESHHIFGGANRKKSEKYGLKIWLCHNHHNENIPNDPGIHFNPRIMDFVQRKAQRGFEEIYSRELFVKEFGRNYL